MHRIRADLTCKILPSKFAQCSAPARKYANYPNQLTHSWSVIDNKNNIKNLKMRSKSFTREPREKALLIYALNFRVQPFYRT